VKTPKAQETKPKIHIKLNTFKGNKQHSEETTYRVEEIIGKLCI
jgi:hypothetical protein